MLWCCLVCSLAQINDVYKLQSSSRFHLNCAWYSVQKCAPIEYFIYFCILPFPALFIPILSYTTSAPTLFAIISLICLAWPFLGHMVIFFHMGHQNSDTMCRAQQTKKSLPLKTRYFILKPLFYILPSAITNLQHLLTLIIYGIICFLILARSISHLQWPPLRWQTHWGIYCSSVFVHNFLMIQWRHLWYHPSPS